ncbi:unnamed protein product [Larinioides sclopetarius]
MCSWPPFKSFKKMEDYVKNSREPEPSWQKIRVHVMKSTDSYEKAVRLEEAACYTSDLNSEMEDVEELSGRKRKRPVDPDSSEDEINYLPSPPKINTYIQRSSGQITEEPQQPPFHAASPKFSYMSCPSTANSASPRSVTSLGNKSDECFKRKVFRMLESIQQDVKEIKQSLKTSRGPVPTLPPSCPRFPCEHPDDLITLEGMLKDEDMFKIICDFLSSIGGNSAKDCTKRILGKLLSTSLSLQYNWKGTRGVKLGFSTFVLINKLIFGAVRNNIICSAATEVEVQEATKKWLMYAKDRDGGRNQRANLMANVIN